VSRTRRRLLADAVRKVFEDQDMAGAMGLASREKVAEFDPDAIASRYVELFREAGEAFAARRVMR